MKEGQTNPPVDEIQVQKIAMQPGYDTETGQWGYGYSPDNGVHFFVLNSIYGRKFRQEDADRIWPFLKGKVRSAMSVSWDDIQDKPVVVTPEKLEQRLAQLNIPTTMSWGQITDKPTIPSIDGLVTTSALGEVKSTAESAISKAEEAQSTADNTAKALDSKADRSELPDVSGLATKTSVDEVRSTANSVLSSAQQAQSTAESASAKASQAIATATNANPKLDTTSQTTKKQPSEYPDGFSYEIKDVSVLDIDRSDLAVSAQEGSTAVMTTKAFNGMARQTAEILDSQRPMTFIRSGQDSTWSTWEVVTTW